MGGTARAVASSNPNGNFTRDGLFMIPSSMVKLKAGFKPSEEQAECQWLIAAENPARSLCHSENFC